MMSSTSKAVKLSRSEAYHFRRIAVEFNNLAVQQHEGNNICLAASLYEDALHVMGEYIRVNTTNSKDDLRHEVLSSWQIKLVTQQTVAEPPLDCKRQRQRQFEAILSRDDSYREIFDHDDVLNVVRPIRIETSDIMLSENDEELTVVILHNTGLLLFQNGRLDLATAHLSTASSLLPERSQLLGSIRFVLGDIYFHQGREKESLQELTAAFRVATSAPVECNFLRFSILNKIGHQLLVRGHVESALQVFDEALLVYSKHQAESTTYIKHKRRLGAPAA